MSLVTVLERSRRRGKESEEEEEGRKLEAHLDFLLFLFGAGCELSPFFYYEDERLINV